jgi:hypothetical protein
VKERIANVSAAVGVDYNTIRQWVSLTDKDAEDAIAVWFAIVKTMKWRDVKRRFPASWVKQYNISDDGSVADQLAPYRPIAEK